MVLRYCFGMIASVSTLIILSGAATPSSTVNLSMAVDLRVFRPSCLCACSGQKRLAPPDQVRGRLFRDLAQRHSVPRGPVKYIKGPVGPPSSARGLPCALPVGVSPAPL